jgi:hypothetical protein
MKNPQITIAHLILIILVVAVALAAIRSGSAAWAGAMFSITFFAVICSLLGVALGRGMRRVYWSGFATLGWGYLLLVFAPWLDGKVGEYLLAPNLFAHIYEVLHPDPQAGGGLQNVPVEILGATATGGAFGGGGFAIAVRRAEAISSFARIGVAIEALLWAFLGGWVACYFALRRDREDVPQIAAPAGAPEARGQGREDEILPRRAGPPV